jgi:hypothetical protein
MTQQTQSKLLPAFAGGAFIGLFSSLPFVNLGNCCCCLWVVLGGGIAAWVFQRRLPGRKRLESRDAAIAGLLAGVFGALFSSFLHYAFLSILGPQFTRGFMEPFMEAMKDMPRELADSFERFESAGPLDPFFVLAGLTVSLAVYSAFAAAGGMLFAALARKQKK